jgi:ribonuclease HII
MKEFDNSLRCEQIRLIAGVDEAGRGPLAGPVVAASVVFSPEEFIEGVDDSKKLTEKKREYLYQEITKRALAYSYHFIFPEVIDEINILQASLLAMKNSIEKLKVNSDLIIVDGNKTFKSRIPCKAFVKGDTKSFSIAAASIIAKVIRDRFMIELGKDFPSYKWDRNKGYPTKEHIDAIKSIGISIHHRKSFLKKILGDRQIEIFN